MDGIGKAFGPIGEMFVKNAPLIEVVLTKLGDTVGTILGKVAGSLGNGQLTTGFLGFVTGLQAAIGTLDLTAIAEVVGMLLGFVGELLPMLSPVINQLAESLVPIFKELIELAIPLAQSLADLLAPAIVFIGHALEGLMILVRPVIGIIKGIVDFLVGVFTGDWDKAWSGIVEIFRGLMEAVIVIIGGVLGGLLKAVGSIFGGIHEAIYKNGEGMRTWFKETGDNIAQGWNDFWKSFGDNTRIGWETVMQFFHDIPKNLANFFKDAGKWLLGTGKSIVMGLLQGIKIAAPWLSGAVDGMMKDVSDYFPHSPAKKGAFSGRGWVTYSGASIATGLADGITSETSSVVAATDALMRAVSMPTSANLAINATTSYKPVASAATRDELMRQQRPVDIHLTSPTPGAAAKEIQRVLEGSGI
jgi:hypothetical protein